MDRGGLYDRLRLSSALLRSARRSAGPPAGAARRSRALRRLVAGGSGGEHARAADRRTRGHGCGRRPDHARHALHDHRALSRSAGAPPGHCHLGGSGLGGPRGRTARRRPAPRPLPMGIRLPDQPPGGRSRADRYVAARTRDPCREPLGPRLIGRAALDRRDLRPALRDHRSAGRRLEAAGQSHRPERARWTRSRDRLRGLGAPALDRHLRPRSVSEHELHRRQCGARPRHIRSARKPLPDSAVPPARAGPHPDADGHRDHAPGAGYGALRTARGHACRPHRLEAHHRARARDDRAGSGSGRAVGRNNSRLGDRDWPRGARHRHGDHDDARDGLGNGLLPSGSGGRGLRDERYADPDRRSARRGDHGLALRAAVPEDPGAQSHEPARTRPREAFERGTARDAGFGREGGAGLGRSQRRQGGMDRRECALRVRSGTHRRDVGSGGRNRRRVAGGAGAAPRTAPGTR